MQSISFSPAQNPQLGNQAVHPNSLSEAELTLARAQWQEHNAQNAQLRSQSTQESADHLLRRGKLMFLPLTQETFPIFQSTANLAQHYNQQYWRFDLTGMNEGLQLARYSSEDHFGWHLDLGPGAISTRKLSVSVQLSGPDEYEGGDLEFMYNDEIVRAPREKGTAIIFPSYLLHRVTPVTQGERWSLVGWMHGPAFR